jgi:hypothetical protein
MRRGRKRRVIGTVECLVGVTVPALDTRRGTVLSITARSGACSRAMGRRERSAHGDQGSGIVD